MAQGPLELLRMVLKSIARNLVEWQDSITDLVPLQEARIDTGSGGGDMLCVVDMCDNEDSLSKG